MRLLVSARYNSSGWPCCCRLIGKHAPSAMDWLEFDVRNAPQATTIRMRRGTNVVADHKARIVRALESIGADVVACSTMPRCFVSDGEARRSLWRQPIRRSFANVALKWDLAENILVPGPYRSETVAFDLDSVRPFPFEPKGGVDRRRIHRPPGRADAAHSLAQIEKAAAAGYTVEAAFEFEFIVLTRRRTRSGPRALPLGASPTIAVVRDRRRRPSHPSSRTSRRCSPKPTSISSRCPSKSGCFEDAAPSPWPTAGGRRCRFLPHVHQGLLPPTRPDGLLHGDAGQGFPASAAMSSSPSRTRRAGNVFADAKDEHGLSATAKSFLAGMIEGVPEAFLCAHTVNDYRRLGLVVGRRRPWAWAPYNYAAAVRTAAETPEMTRLEFRLPGSDCNPASEPRPGAGDGAGRPRAQTGADSSGHCAATEPREGVPRLPSDLLDATRRMQSSKKARTWLGDRRSLRTRLRSRARVAGANRQPGGSPASSRGRRVRREGHELHMHL